MSERFDLSEYKTVAERVAEARLKYPEGRFQVEVIYLPAPLDEKYVAVKARFFRTPDDPTPGEGIAWEPVPGRTPYTKDSELQNAETSAWGRALVAAFVVDTSKGIASREEVRSRAGAKETPKPRRKPASSPPAPAQEPAEAPRSAQEARKAQEEVEMHNWVLEAKTRLLEALRGDKEAARHEWWKLLERFGLDPNTTPEARMKDPLDSALAVELGEILVRYELNEANLLDGELDDARFSG